MTDFLVNKLAIHNSIKKRPYQNGFGRKMVENSQHYKNLAAKNYPL